MTALGNPAEVIEPAKADRDANPTDPNRWIAPGSRSTRCAEG